MGYSDATIRRGRAEMRINVERDRADAQRGLILRYLKQAGPRGATPAMLQKHLFEKSMPVFMETLNELLHYLRECGYVTWDEVREEEYGPAGIGCVKITAAGINCVEGRAKESDGVLL